MLVSLTFSQVLLIIFEVSTCVWDYYYSLQGYDYNSEEYHKKRSEVEFLIQKIINERIDS